VQCRVFAPSCALDNLNVVNCFPTGTPNILDLQCVSFPQFLVNQCPFYDEMIVFDIRPTDNTWIGNVATGTFPSATGVEHILDRFKHVWPNTTKAWTRTSYAGCIGTPCDKDEHCIGWGSSRITYFLEEQSWATPLLCFDQLMHVSHAEEQFAQIISDILRPATSAIQSTFLRKRTFLHSDTKIQANATMTPFTGEFVAVGDEEIFFDTSAAPDNTFKLVPQMLQRQFGPLMRIGYAGKNPFHETAPFIELVTSMETVWELEHLGGATGWGGGANVPQLCCNWRFTDFSAADKYWKYGFSGQLGNFLVRVDPFELRFNFVLDRGAGVGANRYRYQVVLPYVNEVTSGPGDCGDPGLGSANNPLYETAQFAFVFITHKRAITALMFDSKPINPEMPFSSRNWAGRWQFVMDNLGTGQDGCVIENKRRNKGQFIADFKQAVRPEHPEFAVTFFVKREPSCVPEIDTCNPSPGYPSQSYNSCNTICDDGELVAPEDT